jgi:hypothetical protein
MKSKKHTRAAVIASIAVMCVAVLAACALGAGKAEDAEDKDVTQTESETPQYVNELYGFAMEFPFEYGDAIEIARDDDNYRSESSLTAFNITAPNYGIGRVASIEVLPLGDYNEDDYAAMDIAFKYLGSNTSYDFVLMPATDLALDPVTDENSRAFEAISDAMFMGKYEFSTVDIAVSDESIADLDLKAGLQFEILNISGGGTVHARLTNVSSPYGVAVEPAYWVTDEGGKTIPFIEGLEFDVSLSSLNVGESQDYAFMVEELDAEMACGTYFINTNVFISADGGEPVIPTMSAPFEYREPLTEISQSEAESYAQKYVDALNSGEDISYSIAETVESWRKWLGAENPKFSVQPQSVQQRESGGDYEFKVNSIQGDAIYVATVIIQIEHNAKYYTDLSFYCAFSRYYPYAEMLVNDYVAALVKSDVTALASVLAYDGFNDPDHTAQLNEAQTQLDYYDNRCDLTSLALSGNVMYDDYHQRFQQVVLDKNGEGFVLNVIYGDGLVSILPPER